MFRARLLSIVLALLCSVVSAQTAAKLTVMPSDGRAVGLVRTTMAGRWYVLAVDLSPVRTEAFRLSPEAGGGSIIYWEGDPGTSYTVLFAPDDVVESLAAAVVKLGSGGHVGPDPPNPPGPVTAADQVTIVTESQEQLSAEQLKVINGQEVRTAAEAAGLAFRSIDRDVTGPDVASVQHAIDAAKGQPVPRLVFSKAGKVIASVELPGTVAEAVGLVNRYRRGQ
jgi:hypothetical protein